jgi:hypothetical protein
MYRMNIGLIALSLSLICSSVFAGQPEYAKFTREARMSLDATGKVTVLTFVNLKVTKDLIGQRLDPVIRSWQFEPARINGVPMPAETTLSLNLDAVRNSDGGYAIHVLDAFTGVAFVAMTKPDYPMRELVAGKEAIVILLVSVADTGGASDIAVENILTNGSKDHFVDAATDAVKHWLFQPEKVGGQSVESKVRVPIMFCVDESFGHSLCGKYEKQLAAKGNAMQTDTPVALDSHVKLVTKIAGIAL